MMIISTKTVDTVREKESYTLVNKSAVILSGKKINNRKVNIEDSFKKVIDIKINK